ncbi:MAG: hypothetical protein IKA47_04020 [Oscillospiraceae bacterium]|nr:hypothetical protein [Oscillospiraceae bacterium]
MKRFIPLILLILLLCGCGKEPPPETTAATTTAPTVPAEIHTYTPASEVENASSGAVRQYNLGLNPALIMPFEGKLLVASADTESVVTILSGEQGTMIAQKSIPVKLTENNCRVVPAGFAYYSEEEKQVVFRNAALEELNRLQLPENMTGEPAIPQNGKEIYYCADQTVYAIDVAQKTVRPIRTNTCKEQTLLGCYLDGSVIACRILDMADQWNTLYISSADGRLLHKDNGIRQVYSHGNTYFALRQDGTVSQYIYGKATEASLPTQINIADQIAFGALEQGGIVGQTETAESITLNFYNMMKTASVTLPKEYKITQAAADTNAVWLLTEKGVLLHWDLQKSGVTEDIDYTGTVYTAENPDIEGLKKATERAEDIGKRHNVVVRIWEKALVSNDDYDITVEYQTAAINKTLDELEKVLQAFPDRFLYRSVARMIRICIVRDIGGEVTGAYHWYDGDPFIIISAGMDVEKAFLEPFSHILDIHVLGNSPLADNWASLNPEGFVYGAETTEETYLEGETRAFADAHATESVTDDRASIFYYAMQADNAEMFRSEVMQKKLLMLCQAIRDAWRLEEKAETYCWEQYLNQSLAYQG